MEGNTSGSRFKRICVFCGSHPRRKNFFSDAALDLGDELVDRKIDLVYGGGSVGLMGLISQRVFDGKCHVLGFDKRITVFAEEKFQRDGIDLKTGSLVVKVSDSEISTKEIKNGQISSIPYGMVVWSTSIGTRPVIMEFMKQIGQANRRVLATDEWLRVERCDSIYAVGDCATINQRKVMGNGLRVFFTVIAKLH